jgi:HPt (histidine-containing phosphotransfer) domain-containing protein
MYKETFEMFYNKIVKECDNMTALLAEKNMSGFAILIHSMKSSLALVGAVELSTAAGKMEDAAGNGALEICLDKYPPFKDQLLSLHERLAVVFPEVKPVADRRQGDPAYLWENVQKALIAADEFNSDLCTEIVGDLLTYDFGEQTNKLLGDALSALGDFNIGEAITTLNLIEK